jgi:hypothetical protein
MDGWMEEFLFLHSQQTGILLDFSSLPSVRLVVVVVVPTDVTVPRVETLTIQVFPYPFLRLAEQTDSAYPCSS